MYNQKKNVKEIQIALDFVWWVLVSCRIPSGPITQSQGKNTDTSQQNIEKEQRNVAKWGLQGFGLGAPGWVHAWTDEIKECSRENF